MSEGGPHNGYGPRGFRLAEEPTPDDGTRAGPTFRDRMRRFAGRYARYGRVGLVLVTAAGAAAGATVVVPPMMWDTACRCCCDVVMWCSDRLTAQRPAQSGAVSVIDCSFGPYVAGDGMFPWILAERGCSVRVLDLGHEYATDFNPARIVVPENQLAGDISFQVAATHRLIPTDIPKADWFSLILTLQHIPLHIASPILLQSLHAAQRVLVVESPPKPSFASLSVYIHTPPYRRTAFSKVDDLLRHHPQVTVEERHEVGPFTCYVLSLEDRHKAELPPLVVDLPAAVRS
eukprot:TRINITY_DN30527_c0_g1_i1.p1 TRINITY_DN30527_c0_g1~~TRINITY_DN30527_c0_g1_i1.p1  ORF type:complete len:289 (+),score=57.26 TRINITY_DN30527_c0_g1_i1:85-951(+)